MYGVQTIRADKIEVETESPPIRIKFELKFMRFSYEMNAIFPANNHTTKTLKATIACCYFCVRNVNTLRSSELISIPFTYINIDDSCRS